MVAVALAAVARGLFSREALTIVGSGLSAIGLTAMWERITGKDEAGIQTSAITSNPAASAASIPNLTFTENSYTIPTQNDYYTISNSPNSAIYSSKKQAASAETEGTLKSDSKAASEAESDANSAASGSSGISNNTILGAVVIASAAYVLQEVIE